jgi:lysophospholipase L1-like esterase
VLYDRIFCLGDSITLGCNDTTGLGWPGRLGRDLRHADRSVAIYNLGINGDTSRDIAARWRAEVAARSRNAGGLLLFAFGFNDAARPDGGDVQVQLADSVACARELMLAAKQVSEVLWIGPTPLDESVNPMLTDFASWDMRNAEIARYDAAYAELARDLRVDYLPLFTDFLHDPRYAAALVMGDRVHPGDDGYALIAERIAGWDRWRQYFQADPAADSRRNAEA